MVAYLPGGERNPCTRTPPAFAPTLISYTTSRDAILVTGGIRPTRASPEGHQAPTNRMSDKQICQAQPASPAR